MRGMMRRLLPAALLVALGWAGAASANPFQLLDTGPLVTPSSAWTFYGSATTHTNGYSSWSQQPADMAPELTAQARALGANRLSTGQFTQNVADYVRNNIAVEYRFGLGKGARGALIDQSGTPFDQAELMAKLLAKGGVSSTLQVGTMALTSQQFGQWTGLIKNLNQSTQTFDVDAQAACKFLADGGMPATVTDASGDTTTTDCTVLTGNLVATGTAVTVGHIWVVANGTTYNPSYKRYSLFNTAAMATAMGCSGSGCGFDAEGAAVTGSTTGTLTGGYPYIQNASQSGLESKLLTQAQSLESWIQTNNRIGQLEEVAGGKRIDQTYNPSTDPSPPTLSNVVSIDPSIGIPDQYRSQFKIAQIITSSQTITPNYYLYADEIAGRRLRLFSYGTGTTAQLALYADDQLVTTWSCTWCGTTTAPVPGSVRVAAFHPYAGNAGAYVDDGDTLSLDNLTAPVTLIAQWGEAGPSTQQYFADLETADPSPFFGGGSTFCTGTAMQDLCREDSQPTLAAQLMAQWSQADQILGAVSGSGVIHHARMGLVFDRAYGGTPSFAIRMHESIESSTNDATGRSAAFAASASLAGVLEGSVIQQTGDLTDVNSGVADLVKANAQGISLVQVAPSTMTSLINSGQLTNYSSTRQTALNGWNANGFIIPQNGQLSGTTDGGEYVISPTGVFAGFTVDETDNGLASTNVADWASSAIRTAGAPSTGGLGLSATDMVTGERDFPYSLPFTRSYASDAKTQETRETATSYISGTAPTTVRGLMTGAEADSSSRLGGGWSHNYEITARIRNDAFKAMGRDSALDASAAIASIYTLYDTKRGSAANTGLTQLEYDVASILEANWLGGQLINNAVSVSSAGEFEKLPDGAFNPPEGSAAVLTQTSGSRSGPVTYNSNLGFSASIWDYQSIVFDLTGKDGSTIHFTVSDKAKDVSNGSTYGLPVFAARTWTFADGMKLTFGYTTRTSNPTNVYDSLSSVSNSIGRSLTFTLSADPDASNFFRDRITAVTDENGRQVSYSLSDCSPSSYASPIAGYTAGAYTHTYTNNGGGTGSNRLLNCDTFQAIVDPGSSPHLNLIHQYAYAPGADSLDPAVMLRPSYRLRRTYKLSDQTNALQTTAYDELYRVVTTTDILSRKASSYIGAIFPGDLYKRVEAVDPMGVSTLSLMDRWGDVLSNTVDPTVVGYTGLNLTTTSTYDSAHRLVSTTAPEGNSVAYTYDVRSNVLTTTVHAKPGSGLSDAITSTAYYEGPTVFTCVTVLTCNKAQTLTNALGNVTTNTFDATKGGALTKVVLPANANGGQGETDYAYTQFTPTGQPAIWMLTSESRKVSSSQNIVTNYAYNSSNKYVPQTTTLDPTGVNATTTFTYDAVGNLTQTDGPLPNTAEVTDIWCNTYDAARRPLFALKPDPDGTGSLVHPMSRNLYDADGNLFQVYHGAVNTCTGDGMVVLQRDVYKFDAAGRTIETDLTDAVPTTVSVTQVSLDADDRVICTAVRMNAFTSLPDACTYTSTTTNTQDRISRNSYDAAGRLLTTVKGYNSSNQITEATFSYSPNGKRKTFTDSKQNLTTYTYDGFDRLAQLAFPDPVNANTSSTTDLESYSWDANGNMLTKQLRNSPNPASGPVITYCYDGLNRQIKKLFSSTSCATTTGGSAGGSYDVFTDYNLAGMPCRLRFDHSGGTCPTVYNDGYIVYLYDTAGRLTTEATNGRAMTYGYDVAGDRTSITWPDTNFVQYVYRAGGLLTEMRENGQTGSNQQVLADLGYDQLLAPTNIGRAHNTAVATTFGYDTVHRLITMTQDFSGTANDLTLGMSFNAASQLTQLTQTSSNTAYTWTNYTTGTNPRSFDGINRDAGEQALSPADSSCGPAQGYDARGNLTNDGTRLFTYDEENRLTAVKGNSTGCPATETFSYDPLGRLYQTVAGGATTQFLYAGDQLVGEYNGSGTMLRRYVPGRAADQPEVWYESSGMSNKHWLIRDNHGSVIAWADGFGGLGATYAYGPYGEPQAWSGSRFSYTGQLMLPESKLYYYKARIYDPIAGRFLQNDPIGYDGGWNMYEYAGADPVNASDPSGNSAFPSGNSVFSGYYLVPSPSLTAPNYATFSQYANAIMPPSSCAFCHLDTVVKIISNGVVQSVSFLWQPDPIGGHIWNSVGTLGSYVTPQTFDEFRQGQADVTMEVMGLQSSVNALQQACSAGAKSACRELAANGPPPINVDPDGNVKLPKPDLGKPITGMPDSTIKQLKPSNLELLLRLLGGVEKFFGHQSFPFLIVPDPVLNQEIQRIECQTAPSKCVGVA
jgi:RHS repeat-associated protein